ncbi:MAG TPA: glyoxalase, partial [Arthrobacter bacterium]|nr:glyoxalase [Arthrobacter sp.]
AGAEVLIAPEPDDEETPGATATLKDPQGGVFSLLEV